jgi:hypothetical protein
MMQGQSPFHDEKGKTFPRFRMFSANVDHDGDRYGFIRNLKSAQDEINMRRSKALHLLNSRRVISEKGAVDDIEIARREWAKPDGWVETNPGLKMEPDDAASKADFQGQLEMLQDLTLHGSVKGWRSRAGGPLRCFSRPAWLNLALTCHRSRTGKSGSIATSGT